MKKVIALTLAVALGGCASILEKIGKGCEGEATAHAFYLTWIAPFRPAERVAKAVKFHADVQALCARAAPQPQIDAAIAASNAARSD